MKAIAVGCGSAIYTTIRMRVETRLDLRTKELLVWPAFSTQHSTKKDMKRLKVRMSKDYQRFINIHVGFNHNTMHSQELWPIIMFLSLMRLIFCSMYDDESCLITNVASSAAIITGQRQTD